MDTFTLIVADQVVKLGGVRPAARALGRPAATGAAAFDRLESRLAIPIAERSGARLAMTLEGRRISASLGEAARLAESIGRLANAQPASQNNRPAPIALRALERFVLVAKFGSIRRTAQQIGVGQPQLSRQMSNLEAALGARLLLRSRDGVELSPAGEELARLAEELAELWLRLSDDAPDRFRLRSSTLRLGAIMLLGHESATAKLLARLAATWRVVHARTPLFISNATAQDLLMGLQNGAFDLALLDTAALPGQLERAVVSRSPLVLVGAAGDVWPPSAEARQVLTRAPIATTSPKSGLRQKLDEFLDHALPAAERPAARIFEIDSLPTIINLVLEHGFLSVLPQSVVASLPETIRCLQLDGRFDLELMLAWPQTATARRAAQQALKLLARG